MIKPFKKNAVYADLDSLPGNLKGQIIDRDLWALPRAGAPHAFAVGELHSGLKTSHPRGARGWLFLMDVEITFGPHLLVPDISGWRHERMPAIPTMNPVDLAPDWVCEVLSPSTAFIDRGRKREIFADAGIKHVWLVDPIACTIEVLVLDKKSYRVAHTVGPTGTATLAPFEALALNLDEFWAR